MKTLHTGTFDDPLKGWPNDDLLLTAKGAPIWKPHTRRPFRVLDWPELRTAFERHNDAATKAKRKSRVQAFRAWQFPPGADAAAGRVVARPAVSGDHSA